MKWIRLIQRGPGRPALIAAHILLCITAIIASPMPLSAHDTGKMHLHAFGEMGLRILDKEALVSLRPGFVIESSSLHLVLAPAFHLGLADEDGLYLRDEDIDFPAAYGRILYILDFNDPGGRMNIRAGSLAHESLGHGTVVNAYVASLDPDSARTAIRADIMGRSAGMELLAGGINPDIIAARLYAAPMALFGSRRASADRWQIGFLGAVDPYAPISGTDDVDNNHYDTGMTGFVSIDTKLSLYRSHAFSFEPYADGVMTIIGNAKGRGALHLGFFSRFGQHNLLELRAEARRIGTGYIAEPFDSFHSIERWGYPAGGETPKASAEGLPGDWGGKCELTFVYEHALMLALALDGRFGGPFNISARAQAGGSGALSGAALVAFRGIGHESPDSTGYSWLGMGEIRYHFTGSVYLVSRLGRTFRMDFDSGRYRSAWDGGFAVGATL